MRILLFVFIACVSCCAQDAPPQAEQEVPPPDSASASGGAPLPAPVLEEQGCLDFYQSGEYEKAADCFNSFLYMTKVTDTARLVSAYEHLGVCLTMLEKKRPARAAFLKLLDLRADHELDPNVYLPEVISLFQIAKFEKRTSFKVLILDTLPAYPVAWNFTPLGVPQFMNGHRIKGVAACGAQLLLLALSIYSHDRKASFYSDDYGYREEDLEKARAYDYLQRGTFLGLAGVYVYGIIDGFINKRITIKG